MSAYLIIVMGVSGSGKSTIASALADEFKCCFIEADDFHSNQAIAHMASGKPLNDAMRAPWIQALQQKLIKNAEDDITCVMSFSGLRAAHRDAMRGTFKKVLFLHLRAPKHVILARLNARQGHFMPATLLKSQLTALQLCDAEPDVITINADTTITQIIDECTTICSQYLKIKTKHHSRIF